MRGHVLLPWQILQMNSPIGQTKIDIRKLHGKDFDSGHQAYGLSGELEITHLTGLVRIFKKSAIEHSAKASLS